MALWDLASLSCLRLGNRSTSSYLLWYYVMILPTAPPLRDCTDPASDSQWKSTCVSRLSHKCLCFNFLQHALTLAKAVGKATAASIHSWAAGPPVLTEYLLACLIDMRTRPKLYEFMHCFCSYVQSLVLLPLRLVAFCLTSIYSASPVNNAATPL